MGAVTGFSDESYRESIRVTTRETLRRKVERGEVSGGKVYGYRNVGAHGARRREINPAEADIVRRIFELTAQGHGLLRIAKLLNGEGVPSPRGDGWATTAIREMLRRDLYRGRIVYGKTQWIDKGETKARLSITNPAAWITVEAPELRIVSDATWDAAHARIERTRQTHRGHRQPNGELHGRAESALVSRHLLSGFLRCGICGGNMFVCPRAGKRGKPQVYYVCTTRHKRGDTRCTNRHGVPYNEITQTVIDHFSKRFLTPEVLRQFLEDERVSRAPEAIAAERESLSADLRRLDTDIQRLVEAVTAGAGSVPALVDAMKTKQRARDNAAARLAEVEQRAAATEWFDVDEFVASGDQMIVDLEDLLQRDPEAGRGVLRTLLTTPITVTPRETDEGVVFEYSAQARLDGLFAGVLPGGPPKGVRKSNTTVLVAPG